MSATTIELPIALPHNGDCRPCLDRLQASLVASTAITAVGIDRRAARLSVTYHTDQLSPSQLQALIGQAVAELERTIQHATLRLAGIDCPSCVATIEQGVSQLDGVLNASASLATATLQVEYQASALAVSQIERRVQELGYRTLPAATADRRSPALPTPLWQRVARFWPTLAAGLLWAAAAGLGLAAAPTLLVDSLYAAAIGIGGWRIARNGLTALVRARLIGIDLLMVIAVVGAALIGEWSEAAAVVVLFALSEALEGLTADRARQAIRALLSLAPRRAVRRTALGEQSVLVDELQIGDIIVVRPGEQIAADGRVCGGQSAVNQAAITGESLPVAKGVDDPVFAGTLNERGFLEIMVTHQAADSTLARIIQLVETAQATKAPAERLVNRFARIYTPLVLLLAIAVAVIPPLLGQPVVPWIYRALTLLVIACPCALVIATPVAIVAGLARASRLGVLIKGGAHLETLGRLRALAFDKTGTLTQGRPAVTEVRPLAGESVDQVLRLAAAVESRSEHPLATAVLRAAHERRLDWPAPTDFEALAGQGAQARVGQALVVVGNRTLFPALPAAVEEALAELEQRGQTVVLVGADGRPSGLIAVADTVRPQAAAVVAELRAIGIEQIVMLTGDQPATAAAVGQQVGIDRVAAGLLPQQKQAQVARLVDGHGAVAMIGDGVNDAPALATASLGIAMGAAGSDTALETADVALMGDDLTQLPAAIKLSRATLRIIWINIGFALVVKLLFLGLTLVGIGNLWLAILADTGAALLVIANSMRLLSWSPSSK